MNDGMKMKPVTEQSTLSMAQFNCSSCGKQMAARMPNLRVFNFPESSGVVMAHERISKCPHCAMIYIPLINGLGKNNEIQIAWRPIDTRMEPLMETPEDAGRKPV